MKKPLQIYLGGVHIIQVESPPGSGELVTSVFVSGEGFVTKNAEDLSPVAARLTGALTDTANHPPRPDSDARPEPEFIDVFQGRAQEVGEGA